MPERGDDHTDVVFLFRSVGTLGSQLTLSAEKISKTLFALPDDVCLRSIFAVQCFAPIRRSHSQDVIL